MKRLKEKWLWHIALVVVIACGVSSCLSMLSEEILPPCSVFVSSSRSNSGLHPVKDKANNRWGFIDATGYLRIKPQFYSVTEFNEGLAIVKGDSGWGIIDSQGNWKALPQLKLNSARSFCNGLAAVEEKRWGFIDTTGNFAIQPQYSWVSNFSEGRAFVKSGWVNPAAAVQPPYDLIDRQGQRIAQLKYYDVDPIAPRWEFSHGRLGVRGEPDSRFAEPLDIAERRVYWGFVDRSGRLSLPVQFKSVQPFSEGLAAVVTPRNQAGFIDASGQMIIPAKFSAADSFFEGLAAVQVGRQWGYINKLGEIVIRPQFAVANEFSEGLASVKIGEKWGFINQEGNIVIAPQFELVSRFRGGLAQVKLDAQDGYINRNGELVWSLAP